ncbi:MAG: hypothetical protein GY845_18805 [Planctomycetes bacterium]|nr:hypothetical protein [Planctomycetota bacterium]
MIDLSILIQQAIDGDIKRDDANSYCKVNNMNISILWNSMALCIANAFHECKMNYEDADRAMNLIWEQIVGDMIFEEDHEFPETAYSIYCAFDEGEFDHGDGEDPVEKYTKPAIEKIIKKT